MRDSSIFNLGSCLISFGWLIGTFIFAINFWFYPLIAFVSGTIILPILILAFFPFYLIYLSTMSHLNKSRKKAQNTIQLINFDKEKYEKILNLKDNFRFIHEPLSHETDTSRFVGRSEDILHLVNRILYSDGGTFLITCYRGLGKTSFVNQVIMITRKLLEEKQVPNIQKCYVLDVHLNIARPLSTSELLHHIIRRLYLRLNELGLFQQRISL